MPTRRCFSKVEWVTRLKTFKSQRFCSSDSPLIPTINHFVFFGGRHNESSGQRSSRWLIKQLCTGVMGDVGDVPPWMIWGVRDNPAPRNAWIGPLGIWVWTRDPSPLCDWSWQGLTDARAGTTALEEVLCLNESSRIRQNYWSFLNFQWEYSSTACFSAGCRSYGVTGVGVVNS